MSCVADSLRSPCFAASTSGALLGSSRVLVAISFFGLELHDVSSMISDAISIVPASAWDSATSLSGVTAYAPAAKRQFPHWRLLRLSVSNTNSAEINVDVLPSTDVSRILVYQQALFVRWSLAVRQHLVAVTATSAEAVQSAVAQHRGELAALDESLKDADSRAEDQTALSCSDPAVRSRLAWLQDALCQGHAACGAAAVAAITGRAESPQACASAWSAWLQTSHCIIQRLKPVQASAASSPRAVPALPSLPPLPARPVPSGVKTKKTLRMRSAAAAQQLVAASPGHTCHSACVPCGPGKHPPFTGQRRWDPHCGTFARAAAAGRACPAVPLQGSECGQQQWRHRASYRHGCLRLDRLCVHCHSSVLPPAMATDWPERRPLAFGCEGCA